MGALFSLPPPLFVCHATHDNTEPRHLCMHATQAE